jgi:hypothetical protein
MSEEGTFRDRDCQKAQARSISPPKKKTFSGRISVLTNARRWLEYDSVTLAILLFGIGIVMLLALSI